MKKLIAFLLVATFFVAILAGCTTASPTPEATTAPAAGEAVETKAVEETAAPTEAVATEAVATEAVTPEPAQPKVLTYVMQKEPISLDTSKTNDSMSGNVLFLLSEGLIRYYNGQVLPGIAEKWEVSDDGLTYTFHLRDAVWQDGEPVTAQQFEYSFKRFIDPNTAAAFADMLYPVVNAEEINGGTMDVAELGVKALDEKTFQITLKYAVPYFEKVIASAANFYPLRQDFVEQFGDGYAADEKSFLSNGPFLLEKWEHEASITLVKNPSYWDAGAIKLDQITQLIVPDNNTIALMYDNGEVDYVPELAVEYADKYPEAIVEGGNSLQFLEFNVTGMTPETGKVLSNLNFRKALSYAFDRQAISIAVSGAAQIPAGRVINPAVPGLEKPFIEEYPLTEGTAPPTGDPEQAKAYLAAALEELGMTADQLPKLTYVAMESTKHKLYAEAFLDAWNQVLGLTNIEIKTLPVPQALQAGMTQQFDIFLLGLGTDPDPYPMLNNWTIGNSINWMGWEDQTYTDMVKEANLTKDPAERLSGLAEAEKYLIANGPIEPLWFPATVGVHKEYVSGIVVSAIGAQYQLIYADVNK